MAEGAKFVRADLHIHSFGEFGSYDVTDHTMTPEAIVEKAIENGLSIISITDHNEIQNVDAAVKYSFGKDILVIPGIEVSTTQGHLLVYFESFQNLRNFFGGLHISSDKKTCQEGIVRCLELAKEFGGIGVMAHIELDSGFEKTIARFGPTMEEIFKCENLFGLEISRKESIDLYTDQDPNENRKQLVKLRRETLSLDIGLNLPKLMSSDAHNLNKLGLNAENEKRLTRIKVNDLTFQAFKIALLSHESRIRLENLIPEHRPIIKSIQLEGGLFENLKIDLSPNLTCIIGSRGTGKSTLLESVRVTTGNSSSSKVVDSDVWPQHIGLVYEDEVSQNIEFKRDKFDTIRNLTDPVNGITKIDIESYGQGETARTIQDSDDNPSILLIFFDSLLDLDKDKSEEREIIEKLLNNQSHSRRLRLELLSLDETIKALNHEQNKLEILKREKAGDLVKLQNALIKEKQIRESVINDLRTLIKTYREILSDSSTFEKFEKLSDSEIVIGKIQFNEVKKIVADFSKIVKIKAKDLEGELSNKIDDLRIQIEEWKNQEITSQSKIEAKKKELEANGIPFDLGKINQISKDILELSNKVKLLENSKKQLQALENERKELIEKRKALKKRIYFTRTNFADTINKNLKNSIEGLLIHIDFEEGRYSDFFEKQIKELMNWRTSQVPKAKLIIKNMDPLEFVETCKKGNTRKFKQIIDENGNRVFSDIEINAIINKVCENHNYEEFESINFEDRPSIKVTKLYKGVDGKTQRLTRSISQLSLGQQQSVLLAILMLAKSNRPLIIDQPEDNLDSEFIYKTIVTNLRKIKESRQVIIVTHNPNIAVLGDAELIIPLKSTSIKTRVVEAGSIDRTETRKICCEILEGGQNAFKLRQKIYGI